MRRSLFSFLLAILFLVASISAQDNSAILKELLDLPAPVSPKIEKDKPQKELGDDPPPDDAPIDDLRDYWLQMALRYHLPGGKLRKASVDSALRLIEDVKKQESGFDYLLKVFPDDAKVIEGVKNAFDTMPDSEDTSSTKNNLREWLKFNSTTFIDEVTADARNAKDHKEYTSVIHEQSLRALARLDRETALPLLERLESDGANPRTAALAFGLLYEDAIREKDETAISRYRGKLQKVVEDKLAKPSARSLAMEALAKGGQWSEIEDWYISLFEDETLFKARESHYGYEPLKSVAGKDPDKWIPVLTKLIGHKNRVVHNAAVSNLMQFTGRKDALTPLVPWLSDPEWAKVPWSPGGRNTLIQVIVNHDIPEAIPGLIRIVESEDDDEAKWAVSALGVKKEKSAGPAILARYKRPIGEDERGWIFDALIACGGLSDEAMVEAIQAYAIAVMQPGGAEEVDRYYRRQSKDSLPVDISIGRLLAQRPTSPEGFVTALLARIKDLRKTDPNLAAKLHEIVSRWRGKAISVDMLQRAADGVADGTTLISILARREEILKEAPLELTWLTAKSGLLGALGLAVKEDASALQSMVDPEAPEDAAAALAFMRLLRFKMPARDIIPLLNSSNKLLALAAERYLETDNSPDARKAIYDANPGKMRILGPWAYHKGGEIPGRYSTALAQLFSSLRQDYYGDRYGGFEEAEELFRTELKSDRTLLRIYAKIGGYTVQGEEPASVLRVYADRSTFAIYENRSFYRQKTLTREEFLKFEEMLSGLDLENFVPSLGDCHHDCRAREFMSLSREGGWRAFTHSGRNRLGGMDDVASLFAPTGYKLQYYLANDIKGLEVLMADEEGKMPVAFWKNGNDARLLVADTEREEGIREELRNLDNEDRQDEELGYTELQERSRKRKIGRQNEHLSWQQFEKGKLKGPAAEPPDMPYLFSRSAYPEIDGFRKNDNTVNSLSRGYEVRSSPGSSSGIVMQNSTGTIKIRDDGNYNGPVTTPDGRWVVIEKTETDWAAPHSIYRIDLSTNREYKVALEPHNHMAVISFVAVHNKMLVRRGDTFYLLDVNTGGLQQVKGEFRPLSDETYRRLQPTGQPGEFWAAISDREKNETEIGRYDTKTFTFKRALKLPKLTLDSMAIWVDEKEGYVYFINGMEYLDNNHLLRVPLNANVVP